MKLSREEINRKLLHLLALSMPIGIYYIPLLSGAPLWLPPVVLGILLLFSILAEILRFRIPGFQKKFISIFHLLLRADEEKQITGSLYLIGGAFICSLFFQDSPQISFIVLTLFILGDAVASLVGIRFGRTSLFNKTLEGSLGCFLVCLFLSLAIFPRLPYLSICYDNEYSISLMIFISLCICLLELIPVKITKNFTLNDNLFVPPITGLILMLLQNIN